MSVLALLLLAASPQAGSAPAPADPPQRFSILVDPCAATAHDRSGNDVVVCGHPDAISPRLPLPQFRGPPDHPVPSNPDMSAAVALNGPGIGNECGGYGEGCPVGLGGYAVPALVNGAVSAVKGALAKRPDKAGRIAIPLDDPQPTAASIQP